MVRFKYLQVISHPKSIEMCPKINVILILVTLWHGSYGQGSGPVTEFVGIIAREKLFLTSHPWKFTWIQGMDTCRMAGLIPATIDSPEQNALVVDYFNRTGLTDTATDFQGEMEFAWLKTRSMNYSNWDTGKPTWDRSKNCAIINSDGTWTDEYCRTVEHSVLCEIPAIIFQTTNQRQKSVQDVKQIIQPKKDETLEINQKLNEMQPKAFSYIGNVGKKGYYTDSSYTFWIDSLEACHQNGMHLASYATDQELKFLVNYAKTVQNHLHTSGTNLLTGSCENPSKHFYWLHSGANVLAEDMVPIPMSDYRYQCLLIRSDNTIISPDCFAWPARTVCEILDP